MQTMQTRLAFLAMTLLLAAVGIVSCGGAPEAGQPLATVTRIPAAQVPNVPAAVLTATAAPPAAASSPATGAAAGQPRAGSPAVAGSPAEAALAAQGAQLFAQFACVGCHSTTGQRMTGPPLNGLAGSQVTLSNGQTVTADAAYLRESILQPDAKTVQGYPSGVMAATISGFESQIQQDDNLQALIAYIESLK
ncbi:MAG TPA: c-type cytochrome [Thermomicrobiales bacterium]|jgi:cytochrome c oxidase subunit 2|nr:c-type cytochrome [Thermomicrobiales bacterium]